MMRRLLHIVTRPNDRLSEEVIAWQRDASGGEVIVIDLAVPEPDYARLLAEIFAADSVQVW